MNKYNKNKQLYKQTSQQVKNGIMKKKNDFTQ